MRPIPVDVIVVSWNVRDDLLHCIDSVLHSTGVDPRVFVVDNASSDGSASAVEARYPGVSVVRNDENAGFARAANQAVGLGGSPMVLLLNPDTVVEAGAMMHLARFLEAHPGHAAAAPRLVDPDGRPQHSAYRFPSIGMSLLLGTGVAAILPRPWQSRLLLEGRWASDVERDVPWVLGAAMMIRRDVMEEVGPLDESFHM
ncbi:MAG: glycosyltransferase, partial [Candidatus Dormiibacterota bacterium]